MGTAQDADNKIAAAVKAVTTSPLFHPTLLLAAAALLAVEKRWPTVKEAVAGALLLFFRADAVLNSVAGWFKDHSGDPPQSS
jgi:hypothetical protein